MVPSILSWLGWTFLMATGLISQLISEGWEWAITGFMLSTIGCGIITLVSFATKNYAYRKNDLIYVILGMLCTTFYLVSRDAWLTTIFAMTADLILGIPTLTKVYKDPKSEKTNAWLLGFSSWTFSLLICFNHEAIYAIFPIYLFLFNGTMVLLTRRKVA